MRNLVTRDCGKWLWTAALMLVMVFTASAQNRTVTGTVTDKSGEPIIGAVVMVDGVQGGEVTDVDGAYSIKASEGQTLIFTCLGYIEKRVTVGRSAVMDVVMDDDTTLLEEAVSIGYSTVKKRDLTGSVASVGSDAITRTIPTSADQVLQGRAAGVQMTQNSGMPGGGTSIRIRGVNSLNSSNEPIIVIDGVVIDAQTGSSTHNALSSINPNDI